VKNATNDDSEWYQPTDENWYASEEEDPTPPNRPSTSSLKPDPDQPSINTPVLETTTPNQSTLIYAIDPTEDILEMSPECEIDIVSDEPILELTKSY